MNQVNGVLGTFERSLRLLQREEIAFAILRETVPALPIGAREPDYLKTFRQQWGQGSADKA